MSLFSQSRKVPPDGRVKVFEGDGRYNIEGEDWPIEVLLFSASGQRKLSAIEVQSHYSHHIELNV